MVYGTMVQTEMQPLIETIETSIQNYTLFIMQWFQRNETTRTHLIFIFTVPILVVVCSTCWQQKKTAEWNWLSALTEFSLNSMFSFSSNLSSAQTLSIQTEYLKLMTPCIGIPIVKLAIFGLAVLIIYFRKILRVRNENCYQSLATEYIKMWFVYLRGEILSTKIIDCTAGRNWVWGASC